MKPWNVFVAFLLLSLLSYIHRASTNQDNEDEEDKSTRISYRNAGDIGIILQDVKMLTNDVAQLQEQLVKLSQDMAAIADIVKRILYPPGTCGAVSVETGLVYTSVPTIDSIVKTGLYCNKEEWIVIVRRVDDSYDFPNRMWSDYKLGFGDKENSFWLGLDIMHQLTKDRPAKLKVILRDWEGEERYALYDTFQVGSEEGGYRLSVDGYSGDAGDSLQYSNGQRFSTRDVDNDPWDDGSCSDWYKGAWWYDYDSYSQLTGKYFAASETVPKGQGIYWYYWKGCRSPYRYAEMRIKY